MDVFFLFPGRVWIVFIFTGIPTDKEPYRAKVLCLFWNLPTVILEFWFRVSILFLKCFSGANPTMPARNDGRAPASARGLAAIRGRPGALLFALRTLFR